MFSKRIKPESTLAPGTMMISFDSVAEMVEEAARGAQKHPNTITSLGNFYLVGRHFKIFDDVATASNKVWKKGMARYDAMMAELQSEHIKPPVSIRRTARWSEDEGDDLSIDRLRSGAPFWRTTKREHRPGPVNVTIVTDVNASCGILTAHILWRGAAAICLTNLLESAGYRVELWVADRSADVFVESFDYCLITCLLKACNAPVDPSSLINAVSGWFFRSAFFASLGLFGMNVQNNLGSTRPLAPAVKNITPDSKVIIVENVWEKSAAVEFVKKVISHFE